MESLFSLKYPVNDVSRLASHICLAVSLPFLYRCSPLYRNYTTIFLILTKTNQADNRVSQRDLPTTSSFKTTSASKASLAPQEDHNFEINLMQFAVQTQTQFQNKSDFLTLYLHDKIIQRKRMQNTFKFTFTLNGLTRLRCRHSLFRLVSSCSFDLCSEYISVHLCIVMQFI